MTVSTISRLILWASLGAAALLGNALMAQNVPGYPAPAILDLEWSPNGEHLARVFADGWVQILDARLEQIVQSFPPPPIPTLLNAQVDWSSDGTRLAWGVGNTVTLWNLEDEQVERTFLTGEPNGIIISEFGLFPEGVVSLEWSSDDAMLMVLSESVRLSVFSFPSGVPLLSEVMGNTPVSMVWLPNESGISNGQASINIQTKEFHFLEAGFFLGRPVNMALPSVLVNNRNQDRTAVGTVNGYLEIIDPYSGEALSRFHFSDNPVSDITWTTYDSRIVVAEKTGEVRVVDITSGSAELIESINGTLYAVDINPADQRIVLGGILSDGSTAFKTLNLSSAQPRIGGESRLCRINTPRAAPSA